eukprot:8637958-Heterocapsa_arctica.AAC.1
MLDNAAKAAEKAWATAADEAIPEEPTIDTNCMIDDEDQYDYDNEDPISPHASPLQNASSKAMDKHKILRLQNN